MEFLVRELAELREMLVGMKRTDTGRVIFPLSMLRAWAVLNCLIWWVIVND